MKKRKEKIDIEENRYGLFMSEESYDLDIMYGRNYLNNDVKFIISLYRLNIIKSKSNNLYGQAKPKDKEYFPSINLNVMINIEDNKQEQYGDDKGGLVREDTGNLTFSIYLIELEEKNTEINRGDIIEYNQSGKKNRYYEVESAQNITDVTSQTKGGFKPYWKRVIATPVKEDITTLLLNDN